jgi:hypothetical protein
MLRSKISVHVDSGIRMVACVDLSSGVVLDSSMDEDDPSGALDLAAQAVCQLSTSPRAEVGAAADPDAREALIVSDRAIHALARSDRHPDRIVVAVAPPSANVALVLAAVRSMAETLAP